MLGLEPESPHIAELLSTAKLPYKIVPTTGKRASVGVRDPSGEIHSAEELVVSLLSLVEHTTGSAYESHGMSLMFNLHVTYL